MANTALIPVFTGHISNTPAQLCNARELHAFLGVGRDFTNWIKARIRKFGFVQGEDYIEVFAKSGENLVGRPSTEYHLTLDMAKELSMVENNEQGRAARKYFIACERELTGTAPQLAPTTLTPAQAHAIKSAVEAKCKGDSKAYSACYHALYDAFRVPSYKDLPATRFDAALAFVQSWAFDPPALPATNPQAANLPALPGTAVLVNRTNLAALINLGKLLHDLTYQQGLHSALSAMASPLSARLSGIATEFQFTSALLAHHINNH